MRIALFGTGNLAKHLIRAFEGLHDVYCVQWIGRKTTAPNVSQAPPYFTSFQNDIAVDLCIIAVSDDQISEVAQKFRTATLVVHTAGAITKQALSPHKRKGVFYPLQSFLDNRSVDWSTVPICVEASNKKDTDMLLTLAHKISTEAHHINEEQRLYLHAAAVFANNFCNHLLGISQDITAKKTLPFSLLKPIIKETFERSFATSATDVQTGPAKRHDVTTQAKHLDLLSPEETALYKALSQSIFKKHNT